MACDADYFGSQSIKAVKPREMTMNDLSPEELSKIQAIAYIDYGFENYNFGKIFFIFEKSCKNNSELFKIMVKDILSIRESIESYINFMSNVENAERIYSSSQKEIVIQFFIREVIPFAVIKICSIYGPERLTHPTNKNRIHESQEQVKNISYPVQQESKPKTNIILEGIASGSLIISSTNNLGTVIDKLLSIERVVNAVKNSDYNVNEIAGMFICELRGELDHIENMVSSSEFLKMISAPGRVSLAKDLIARIK